SVGAHEDLISEGETPGNVHLILEGFACRYKILNGGQRHIVAYLIPGDFCDLHSFILKAMDHTVGTLSPCKVVGIQRHGVLEMTESQRLRERSGGLRSWTKRPCASGSSILAPV